MKYYTQRFFAILLLLVFTSSHGKKGPYYSSVETKEVIGKMIEAHGGYEKWENAETFSFQNIMFSSSLGESPFWINEVTVDQKSRMVYQDWLLHEASMVYDGNQTWSENWSIGNPPKFEALFFYYFLNLPWITQDDNVVLGNIARIKHDSFENEVYTVEMTFSDKPAVGKTKDDNFKLYIDTKTFLLKGYEYSIGYGHMLDLFGFPEDKKLFGPMFRINDAFKEVDGLIFPTLMHTGNTDMSQVYGNHAIVNYSLDWEFDSSRLKKTQNSVLDNSSEKRRLADKE